MRNVEQTKHRLMDAVGQLLARKGFTGFGVNALAREAGVNKALIYRYFGDMEGLISAYASAQDFWPSLQELLVGVELQESSQLQLQQVAYNYWDGLARRPHSIAVMAWELTERNGLTAILESHREKVSIELLAELAQRYPKDPLALQHCVASLSAAIHYLLLRRQQIRWYAGIDLQDEQAVKQLIANQVKAVSKLLD